MNVNKGRLLKKSSNRKSKLVLTTLVTTWLSIAFHLRPIWLQTLVAIEPELCLTSFSSFCAAIWSRCAVQFESEQTPFPRTGPIRSSIQTCCFAQDSIRNMLFCSYLIFLLRDEWMIEIFSKAMGAALVGNNFSPILWIFHSIHFSYKKKSDSLRPEIYKVLNPYWLLNWVSIARVVLW